ncbi:MAG TPA: class I SAM-dependent methyltransferase [Candidatus Lokiarchaeia archaeon]|nr:class I SAM-dependent methyltransferase [Candidatus Lokiarchaeia archaeon]
MVDAKGGRPDYGNWVSTRLLYIFGGIGIVILGLSFLFAIAFIGAGLFLLVFAYFAYARYRFSPRGGDIQAKIRELVLANLDWDGEGQVIDIGCGNAPLAILLAQKYPNAQVTGIDYWGGQWEYSKEVCEQNAASEGVADRVTFQKASASKLPFDDATFGAAVSNLVFHEVKDASDKRDVIKEALRVVKPGGKYAFQDLFGFKQVYGDIGALLETIRSWGIDSVEYIDTHNSTFIPRALRLPFMIGTIGILYGTK